MPIYEYRCTECGAEFEAIAGIAEKDETECPGCGAPAERQLSAFAVRGEAVAKTAKRCYTGG